jgi:diguanylate cyclase (GGDEF)-like protein
MILDAATLLAALVLVSALLGGLLFLSWLQNRAVAALAWWSLAFLLGTAAIMLLAARNRIPDVFSIDLANALALVGFGLVWHGTRLFVGRRPRWTLAALGALAWLAVCQLPAIHGSYPLRLSIGSAMIGCYAVAIGAELWRSAEGRLPTRRVTAIFFIAHGLFLFFVRVPFGVLALRAAEPPTGIDLAEPFYALFIFETLVFTVSVAFLLLSTAKEQLELEHRRAALVDPLTGVANRRGFLAEAERVLARARHGDRPVALLVFDLDRFKSVNDSFGHQAGDSLLQAFAAMLASEIRPADRIGRIGGEEFAALLPETDLAAAADAAERLRRAATQIRIPVAGRWLTMTTSVGVAAASQGASLSALVAAADAALYRAKANGRDRVECAAAALPRVLRATADTPEPLDSAAA